MGQFFQKKQGKFLHNETFEKGLIFKYTYKKVKKGF